VTGNWSERVSATFCAYWAGTTLGHIDDTFQAAQFEPDMTFVSRSSGRGGA